MAKSLSEKFSELIDREKDLSAILDALNTAKEKTAERIRAAKAELQNQAKDLENQSQNLEDTLQNL